MSAGRVRANAVDLIAGGAGLRAVKEPAGRAKEPGLRVNGLDLRAREADLSVRVLGDLRLAAGVRRVRGLRVIGLIGNQKAASRLTVSGNRLGKSRLIRRRVLPALGQLLVRALLLAHGHLRVRVRLIESVRARTSLVLRLARTRRGLLLGLAAGIVP